MKKLMLCSSIVLLVACSTPPQQSSVPMDMQAVAAYQHRVATGKTIDKNNPTNNEALNQSDRRSKEVRIQSVPAIYPSVGYGYGWGRHHIGLGSGYWY